MSLVKNLRKETIWSKVQHALKVYHARGFDMVNIHSDMEFECMQHDFLPTTLNLTPCNVHISKVKCSIWTIKEHIRADIQGMPFKCLPKS